MRIRRLTNEDHLWAALEAVEPDVLPLVFTDEERRTVAWTIAPELAALAPGEECRLERVASASDASDVVLVAPSPDASLARRYAALMGRRLVIAAPGVLHAALRGTSPRSITWFLPDEETDVATALASLHAELTAALGRAPPIGVLTAECPAKLTWLLAKQIAPRSAPELSTTVVSREPSAGRPRASLTLLGSTQSVADVVAGFNDARGTLLIDAHSRPHCGVLPVGDGAVGMCSLDTGGAGGRCVDGTLCFFGEAPRAVLHELRAQRVFFNGCSTASLGSRRLEHVPRAARVGHATLRGGAREYVGNVRSGFYDGADLDWFLGASALGYTPAQCVEIVEAARRTSGREAIRSCLYFGDANNPAWPVQGVVVGEAVADAERAQVRWTRADRVLVARLEDRTWAALAQADRLGVRAENPSRQSVSVLADPWGDGALVLVVPRATGDEATDHSSEGLTIELRALPEPFSREVGAVLSGAVESVRWLESVPAFREVLGGASRHLEEEVIALRRAAAFRSDLTMLPELLDHVRASEIEAACRFDAAIVEEALVRTRVYWNWGLEYGERIGARPRAAAAVCPICGGLATETDLEDYASPGIARTTEICPFCGIVADLPACGVGLRLVPESLVFSEAELTGTAEVSNKGGRARRVTLGVGVERAGPVRPESRATAAIDLAPGAVGTFDFRLVAEKPMIEILAPRVYLASEGAFGYVSTFLLFGGKSARSGSGDRLALVASTTGRTRGTRRAPPAPGDSP